MIDLSDILTDKAADVIAVAPQTSVREAARILANHDIGVVMVVDDAAGVRGILSERDLTSGLAQHGDTVADRPVTALMTTPVISCTSSDSIVEIFVLMNENHIRHLPVIDDGALVAMLSMRDIQSAWLDALDRECETLRAQKAA
jgi:CBS domain-containing protein